MDEKVKLIIEIDKSDYNRYKRYYLPSDVRQFAKDMVSAVAKGVPYETERKKLNDIALDLYGEVEDYEKLLEDLRTEIEEEKIHFDMDIGQEIHYNQAIDDVLEIIDKHINEKRGEETG